MTLSLHTLTDELHLHLYGCLTAADVHALGRDRWRQVPERLAWYAAEYEAAYGRRPDAPGYWTRPGGLERLRADFEFTGPGPFGCFQACFNLLIALFPVTPGDTSLLRHVLAAQRAAGVRYGEYRCFVPPPLAAADVARYVASYADAAAEVQRESAGAYSPRLAFSLCREPQVALAQHAALTAVLAARPELAEVVTGVDFCGVEAGHPPREIAAVFAAIHAENARAPERALAILYHVGETFDELTLASAARWVWQAHAAGAHRLGHAIALGVAPEGAVAAGLDPGRTAGADAEALPLAPVRPPCRSECAAERRDHLAWLLASEAWLTARGYGFDAGAARQELEVVRAMPQGARVEARGDAAVLADARRLQDALLEDLAARGAVVESCPTSNFRIGRIAELAHHPLPRFLAAGLRTLVSTDDPGVFGITLHDEEELCRNLFELSTDDLRQLQATAEACRSERLSGRV